jgi:hypothetical protein
VHGAAWDEDIANGLLHSICYVPVISFRADKPLETFAEGDAQRIAMGWAEAPPDLNARLCWPENDRVDSVLVEALVADALLQRSSVPVSQLTEESERGRLRAAIPVIAVLEKQQGRPENPHMDSYIGVPGISGHFSEQSLHNVGRAAAKFLRDRAGLSVEEIMRVKQRSVASAVNSMVQRQGCCLWDHVGDPQEAPLTSEQKALVGMVNAGPPLEVNTGSNLRVCSAPTPPSEEKAPPPCTSECSVVTGNEHDIIWRVFPMLMYHDSIMGIIVVLGGAGRGKGAVLAMMTRTYFET